MPTNNFKLFDEKKANMMSDDDYAINQQRLNGVQSGVASSQLQNKTLYQTALMCYALAQLMAANGYDANDADAVSTFVNNLSLSMVQKVVDKASVNDVANQVAGKWVDAKQLGELKTDVADNYLSLLGGTMLGNLILHSDPVSSLQAATKQYVDTKDLKLYTGSYVGTGKYGSSNPTSITFPFEPIILIGPISLKIPGRAINMVASMKTSYEQHYWFSYQEYLKISADRKTISWYNTSSTRDQFNDSGYTYYYAAIGGYDIGGQTEWIITQSGTWTVPRTGRYMLELYGGGGSTTFQSRYQGGSSCQSYDSISLTTGDVVDVTIGAGLDSAKNGTRGGTTTFGQYSVLGGEKGGDGAGGAGSGNKGTDGQYVSSWGAQNNSTGILGQTYGYGVNGVTGGYSRGGNGAVYLKYLGD